jgi:hypothetical protein
MTALPARRCHNREGDRRGDTGHGDPIHSGTYPGGSYISDLAGSATAPIWLGGAPGDTSGDRGRERGAYFSKVRYLVVHDLEGRNTALNGINIDDAGEYANGDATRYVLFQRINVHDVGGGGNEDCLKMSGVNDYWVLDSSFAAAVAA